jgi:DNA-binding PadR family transcriptional regulator
MGHTAHRKLLLLGLLREEGMHGYLLHAHLDGAGPIELKKPAAYHLLDRMEQDGWLEHRDDPVGERPRKVYSLTSDGERAFQGLLRDLLATDVPPDFPGLVPIAFLDALPADQIRPALEQRRRALEGRLEVWTSHGADDSAGQHSPMDSFLRRSILLEIEFVDELLRSHYEN